MSIIDTDHQQYQIPPSRLSGKDIDMMRSHEQAVSVPVSAREAKGYDYEMKSWPWFYQAMIAGRKKHDMRDKRKRPYEVGDRVLLREWDPRSGSYTGGQCMFDITYITSNDSPCALSSGGLDRNMAILSMSPVMETVQ